jgi:hypothetical protein
VRIIASKTLHFHKKVVLIFFACFSLELSFVYASDVQLRGTSNAMLNGSCGRGDTVKGKKDKQIFSDTLLQAKSNAIRVHVANRGIAIANAFESKKTEILNEIDVFLLNQNIRILCERKSKVLKISVTGDLNQSAFDRTLALKQSMTKDRSRITSVFVARRQKEVKSFETRKTTVARNIETSEATQIAEINTDGSMSATGSAQSTQMSESGGNKTFKSDRIEYETYRPDGLETAINEIFVSLGYRPINNSQVEDFSDGKFDVARFEAEFSSNENISNKTLSDAFSAISSIIPILVVARLDVGAPVIKGGNENPLVVVDVKAQVYKFDGLFYETVASYGPVQVKNSGITATAAENNAILEASRVAATQLGAQLLQNNIY